MRKVVAQCVLEPNSHIGLLVVRMDDGINIGCGIQEITGFRQKKLLANGEVVQGSTMTKEVVRSWTCTPVEQIII